MHNKEICFITVVNDEAAYAESLFYINNITIPKGIEIKTIGIRNAKSITSAYNEAMKNTKAKYKVYLHQDTLIINKNFIFDILEIFTDDKVGLIGVCGANEMPNDGIWWESQKKTGKVYDSFTGKMKLLKFDEVITEYEQVQSIDGLIMITQHDINWRSDLFDGWHFYDVSQSTEFIRRGYKVVVAKQIKPWCIHDCGIANVLNGFEKYRNIYVNEYITN